MFPTTGWSVLREIRQCTADTRCRLLDVLVQRYWHPVFVYLRGKGMGEEDAAEQTQAFFVSCLEKDFFLKADQARGRFRTFLLSSLNNYLANVYRREQAKRRCPSGGFVSLDRLVSEYGAVGEPREEDTPEDAFNREWGRTLLLRVLKTLLEECRLTGKEQHYELFLRRIIRPHLEGANPPPMAELAAELGMTQKQASNALLTARRAYQRLLREEVRSYAVSQADMEDEIRDLFRLFSR